MSDTNKILAVGIDYSMRSPSVVLGHPDHMDFQDCKGFFLETVKKRIGTFDNLQGDPYPSWDCDMERYRKLADWTLNHILESLHPCSRVVVALEGYSMASRGKVFHIAENTAILKSRLYDEGWEVEIIAPTSLKKFATGSGRADKDQMHEALKKESGIDLRTRLMPDSSKTESPVSDVVDAYYLSRMAASLLKRNR